MTARDAVPRLRAGVRRAYDRTRDSDVVLFPEGVLVLNETAAAVLARCDGSSTIAEITEGLAEEFDGVRPEDVAELVADLARRRVVRVDG
ncbi:pyrroloquinoline quinone biosynthesis peptide chaperone PqqD [Solihabitans fulvus]|uniref:Pyrroloquinoline quinone biosynthesis peptide chaperone PqqD n=1 Tax=Solihabitans fulvus TaxID=1892852 RepID=A0A5B2XJV1_9PSEU|nr:pyrroloquinoline quinone biosynthesis peptide chaperone PqqD [Solihabitans fulvus]KAA2263249.1 pyrroloquinoline quinone biosynthesis peptide chaperone PqqD [Solihabitans fulvus]